MPQGTGNGWPAERPTTTMLDSTNLRATVTSGQYVVDPFAVADALLARAGIAMWPGESRDLPRISVSRDGARTRPDPEPPSPHA